MRITSGILGGRRVEVPGRGVRPTQDKVRAALFSSLGAYVTGARVLDLYAGSGALGLEAWSRGASAVCWVERDRQVFALLKANVGRLCVGEGGGAVSCVMTDALGFVDHPPRGGAYDLVLADPPYDRDGDAPDRLGLLLERLRDQQGVKEGGFLVYEQSADEALVEKPGWMLVKEKKYGDTRLLFYRRKEEGAE